MGASSESSLDAPASRFVSALALGRAVLLIGQAHSTTVGARLRNDIAAALQAPREGSFRDQWLKLPSEALAQARAVIASREASQELVDIAQNPWAMVIISAVDPLPMIALQAGPRIARRLHVVYAAQTGSVSRSQPSSPTVVRLFGSTDETDPRLLPPPGERELARTRAFTVAPVVSEIPRLVGPGGVLAVVGIARHDWIEASQLALALDAMPHSSIFWFQPHEDALAQSEIEALLGNRVVIIDESFEAFVGAARAEEQGALAQAREVVVAAGDRTITLRVGGRPKSLTVTAAEWRGISRVADLLPDEALAPPERLSAGEEDREFREFLRSPEVVPNWGGVAKGYLFSREVADTLLAAAEDELIHLASVHAPSDQQGPLDVRRSRIPILIQGGPGAGKSRLLHWLAFHLRQRGHCVVYLLPTVGRLSFEVVGRVCQTLEAKGAPSIAVLADGLDTEEYGQLSEFLASNGRNAQVVGTSSSVVENHDTDKGAPDEPPGDFRAIVLPPHLTEGEIGSFKSFLTERGFPSETLTPETMRERYFLLLLYRLLPETRGNIQLAVAQDYEALLRRLDATAGASASEQPPEEWKRQLARIAEELFPELAEEAGESASPFHHDTVSRQAVNLALFCSQIDRPIPLDLLVRAVGPDLITRYQTFAQALVSTALLREAALDAEGTPGVVADHAFVAGLALRLIVPDRASQLDLLRPLVLSVSWDESAFPGEHPDQDFVISVMKAVGPRGSASEEFESMESLQELAELLGLIRERRGAHIGSLMLLEANTLRLLAKRQHGMDIATRQARCEDAIRVLQETETLLRARRATHARNAELMNVLTLLATTYGFLANTLLDQYRDEPSPQLRNRVFAALAEVRHYSAQARGVGPSSYYPVDVAFWAHRDVLEGLADLAQDEETALLARIEGILDSAGDEPIEQSQVRNYQKRQVNLAQLKGNLAVSEALAAEMLSRGDFSGVCLLVRNQAFDPNTGAILQPRLARSGLERLEGYAPLVFGSEEATRLMHRLWMAANLNRTTIGGEEPILAACARDDWIGWRRILEARLSLPGGDLSPYIHFCLAWTLLQLGEYSRAISTLRVTEPLTIGNRRRVGALAVVTMDDGSPREFAGLARRRDPAATIVYVPELQSELHFGKTFRFEGGLPPRIGDELRFFVGLNYRSLTPWQRRSSPQPPSD